MAIQRNIAGTWTTGCIPSVKQGGVWRAPKGVWVFRSGAWRKLYEVITHSGLVSGSSGNRNVATSGFVFKGQQVTSFRFTLSSSSVTLDFAAPNLGPNFFTRIDTVATFVDGQANNTIWAKDAQYTAVDPLSGGSSYRWTNGVGGVIGGVGYSTSVTVMG